MLDVVPPSPGQVSQPRWLSRRRPVAAAPTSSSVPRVGPRVVSLNWRLPARLRRPIKQELARARQQKKQEQAIVHFERRPLYTELPSPYPKYRSAAPAHRQAPAVPSGVEQHTADVYKNSRPNVGLPVPPYRGRAAARFPGHAPARASQTPRTLQLSPRQAPRGVAPAKKQAGYRHQPLAKLAGNVRDVPYQWQQREEQSPAQTISLTDAEKVLRPVQQPKRRLALPLHLSVFPWRRQSVPAAGAPKKKV